MRDADSGQGLSSRSPGCSAGETRLRLPSITELSPPWVSSGWYSSLGRRRPWKSRLDGASNFARRHWSQQRRE